MLDLNNFKNENKVSLNSLLTTRKELSTKRASLILQAQKYQKPFDRSYLQNPDYIKIQETLKADFELITDISNCINLYYTYNNIAGNEVTDDRPEINNVLTFEKASKKSFDSKKHKLGFVIISNKITKSSFFKGIDEAIHEDFLIDVEPSQTHKYVENRFEIISHAIYEVSNFYSVNDYLRKGHRVVYGYRNENNKFFETGYIS